MELKNNPFPDIKKSFEEIYKGIEGLADDDILNGTEDRFRPYLDRLNQMVATPVDDDLVEKLLEDNDLQKTIPPIAHVKRLHSIRMETLVAKEVIRATDPWEVINGFVYYPNYIKLAEMEYTGANLSPKETVAFIGSGPLPLSLILLCKRYDIYGIGLEKTPEYMDISSELVDKLGLTRHIRIVRGDHFALPLETDCSLVMVGAEALPKEEIFNHLATVLPIGAKLSYRIFEKGLRQLLDDQSDFVPPPVFREYTRVRPEPPVNNTAVFLIKE